LERRDAARTQRSDQGPLLCEPLDDDDSRGYAFTATGTYRRLLGESVNVGGGPNAIDPSGCGLVVPFEAIALPTGRRAA
jgi:hypothetical protein